MLLNKISGKKIFTKCVLLVILITVFSCIEEMEIFQGSNPTLVVDGVITDEPGPHAVRITISRMYNEAPSYQKVVGADVRIVDGEGNEEILTYSDNGFYFTTPSFAGVIGRTYHLKVRLSDGSEYVSLPEKMNPVPEIQNVTYIKSGTHLDFKIDFADNSEEENFYRWRYVGTYEVSAPKAIEYSKTNQPLRNSDCIRWTGAPPAAKDVSYCWTRESDTEFLTIESDFLFNGRTMTNFPLFSMELGRKFDRGYNAEVKQYSLSKAGYEYWKAIKDQMANNGTMFETNNYHIRGNIRAVSNETESVLGYFGASAVSSKSVFVFDFMGLYGPVTCEANNSGCFPERCLDCRRFSQNATNVKPAFWPY